VVYHRKPRMQTPVVSRYPTPTHVHELVLLFMTPCGPHLIPFGHRVHQANLTCLSTHQRPRKAKTFRACSSPAPMQIKLQLAPTILGQDSLHTMLSITHHIRERPSTGPHTLRFSISPLISKLTTHKVTNLWKKEKQKKRTKNSSKLSKSKKSQNNII
jgi:hypothetical protein